MTATPPDIHVATLKDSLHFAAICRHFRTVGARWRLIGTATERYDSNLPPHVPFQRIIRSNAFNE